MDALMSLSFFIGVKRGGGDIYTLLSKEERRHAKRLIHGIYVVRPISNV
jgi:hypothetical protein